MNVTNSLFYIVMSAKEFCMVVRWEEMIFFFGKTWNAFMVFGYCLLYHLVGGVGSMIILGNWFEYEVDAQLG